MAFLKWDKNLLIHVKEIDNQHKKLYELTNRLHEDLVAGQGDKILGEILKSLVDYVQLHFTTEEKLMEKHKYPLIKQHKTAHKDFISKIQNYLIKYKNKTPLLAREILMYLKGWYEEHIIHTDKIFGTFLLEKFGLKVKISGKEKSK